VHAIRICLLHSLAKLINTLDEANAHIFFPVEHCLFQAFHRVQVATKHLEVFPSFTFCFGAALPQFSTFCFNALDSL